MLSIEMANLSLEVVYFDDQSNVTTELYHGMELNNLLYDVI